MLEWYIVKTAIGEEANVASEIERGPVKRLNPSQIGGVMIPQDGQGNNLYPGYILVELEWSPHVVETIHRLPGSFGFQTASRIVTSTEFSQVFEGVVDPDASTTCGTPEVLPRDEVERLLRCGVKK